MNNIIKEIKQKLKQLPPSLSPSIAKAYLGGRTCNMKFLGLKIPQIHSVLKSDLLLNKLSKSEAIKVLDYFWEEATYFEERSFILMWVKKNIKEEELPKYFKIMQKWVKGIDSWAHSDPISDILAKILEQKPSSTYKLFIKWNKSKNPWERRQSTVSLLYYSGLRKKTLPYSKLISLVDSILDDDHFYVQKGAGWTLREIYNLYPNQTVSYIRKNIHRIPSAGYTACTEKLSKNIRTELKELRIIRIRNKYHAKETI